MKAKDFEQAFDEGEDILESLDLSKAKRSEACKIRKELMLIFLPG